MTIYEAGERLQAAALALRDKLRNGGDADYESQALEQAALEYGDTLRERAPKVADVLAALHELRQSEVY